MTTLRNASGTDFGNILTANATLRNLPVGASTLAALVKVDDISFPGSGLDALGLVAGSGSPGDWFHTISIITSGSITGQLQDDDGAVGAFESTTWNRPDTAWIVVAATRAAGIGLTRFHHKDISTPQAWGHNNSAGNNGGSRLAPGSAFLRVGYFGDNNGGGDVALIAAWVGTALTDLQIEELAANAQTSDWWNCSGGHPTALVELNTATPSDIGSSPSPFNDIGTLTFAGDTPPWTFDGQGVITPITDEAVYRHNVTPMGWR